MISWSDYLKNFTEEYGQLLKEVMEDGAVEYNGGPIIEPRGAAPSEPPFGCDWAIRFIDGKYFRVKESFDRIRKSSNGKRVHFSFHYGKAHPNVDADGFPCMREPDTPAAELRIDLDATMIPHIHCGSPEHIPQERVSGFEIQTAELFQFVRAVIQHRRTGQSLLEIFNITVLEMK